MRRPRQRLRAVHQLSPKAIQTGTHSAASSHSPRRAVSIRRRIWNAVRGPSAQIGAVATGQSRRSWRHQVHLEVAQHARVDQDGRGVLVWDALHGGTLARSKRCRQDSVTGRIDGMRWPTTLAAALWRPSLTVPAAPRAGRRRTDAARAYRARARRPRREGAPAGRRPQEGQAPDLAADLRRELRGQAASPSTSTCRSTAGAATAPRPTTGRSAAATTGRTGTSPTSRTAGPTRSATASAARTTAPRTPRCSRTGPPTPPRC